MADDWSHAQHEPNCLTLPPTISEMLPYTDTDEGFRYISLRKAEKYEEIRYYKMEINHGDN